MRRVLLIGLLVLSGVSQAEQWVAFDPAVPRAQYDADSVQHIHKGTRVTWRMPASPSSSMMTTYTGMVSCTLGAVAVLIESTPQGKILDYQSRVMHYNGETRSIPEQHLMQAEVLPYPDDSLGQLVKVICVASEEDSSQVDRHEHDKAVRKFLCGDSNSSPPICSSASAISDGLSSLRERSVQGKVACKLSDAELTELLTGWLEELSTCATPSACRAQMRARVEGISGDYGQVVHGRQCIYLPAALGAVREREAKVVAFRTCLSREVDRLDDRVSPAETVAKTVYSSCRDSLPIDLRSLFDDDEERLPVVEKVLEQRAVAGRADTK